MDQTSVADYQTDLLPFNMMSTIGLFVLSTIMVIVTLGGISGANVILPIILIFFRFEPKIAIAHTTVLSLLSVITRVTYEIYLSMKGKHYAPKINYHLVMIGSGPCILGAFIGVEFNKMCPVAIIVILTCVLLTVILYFSGKKFLQKYREEKENEAKKAKESLMESLLDNTKEQKSNDGNESKKRPRDTFERSAGSELDLNDKLKVSEEEGLISKVDSTARESNQYKITFVDSLILLIMLLVNPFVTLLRGSHYIKPLISMERCSWRDFSVLISYVSFLIIITMYCATSVYKRNKNLPLGPKDVEFNSFPKIAQYALSIMTASFVGGFLASGSTTILSILLMLSGIDTFIASSTTLLIAIIYTTSSAVLYSMNGFIYLSCALIGGAVVVLSTLVTRMTIYQYFLKHGKASMILLFISIMMMITIPSNIIQVGPHIKQQYDEGKNIFKFESFCR